MKEKLFYKNKNGKIICLEDMFGNKRYVLLNAHNEYVKDLTVPFCVGEYL
jgi:hypothetical protein